MGAVPFSLPMHQIASLLQGSRGLSRLLDLTPCTE